jgi:hypothetical protein
MYSALMTQFELAATPDSDGEACRCGIAGLIGGGETAARSQGSASRSLLLHRPRRRGTAVIGRPSTRRTKLLPHHIKTPRYDDLPLSSTAAPNAPEGSVVGRWPLVALCVTRAVRP